MAYDGTLKFDTKINPDGFQNGINKLGTIVKGAAVFKVLSAGVDMVKSSVDAAFGRIDTMEQFNRVMNVMTHDTGITNKALADTNQIVKGTAYGLNVASKAVQSFVSRGMEVKKSTDTVEGFADAVSFFGDGTNATLESVMSALGKMQTKGNVTMEHLEMLFNAGIPAVEIYANAVGMSTEEVTAAISKGKLRTDDFISTMNQAFKTGVEGFPSIAGAAKEAGASWTGTFDNMRAAITRGTQAIITSIDSALESVGKPSTREMIANFGKTFEKVLNTIAGAAGGVVKHLDLIAFGITTVGAVMLGLRVGKVLTGIVQGFQLAAIQVTLYTMSVNGAVTADALQTAGLTAKEILVGVLTGKITIATAAQYAWNVAMTANPIGLVIAGIGLLIAAVVGVTMALNKNSVAYEKSAEKVEKLKDAHEQLKTAMEDSEASYEDSIKNQATSSITAGELLNTLTRLSSVENKSVEEKKQMALIVKQLNQSYGGLNLTYDEGKDLLNQNIDKIKEYCGAQNFIAEATLREERYNELLQEQGQLTVALNEEQNHRSEILKQWRAGEISEKECNKLIKEISELENDYNKSFEENADKIKN